MNTIGTILYLNTSFLCYSYYNVTSIAQKYYTYLYLGDKILYVEIILFNMYYFLYYTVLYVI